MVSNVDELDLLMMHNRKYCAEIAHNVGSIKRKEGLRYSSHDPTLINKLGHPPHGHAPARPQRW